MKRLALILMLWAAPLLAVEPDEVLSDPALEARARDLSQGLRCLVCRNESIDESNASLARDLRLLLRERLVAGDSDQEAVDFIVARYGEYVLLKPSNTGANRLLWAAGPLMLLLVAALGMRYLRERDRARKQSTDNTPLTETEESELRRILGE